VLDDKGQGVYADVVRRNRGGSEFHQSEAPLLATSDMGRPTRRATQDRSAESMNAVYGAVGADGGAVGRSGCRRPPRGSP
jgi:hypothetical protein